MLMPSIFGERLFDDWTDFSFPDVDKMLYGKHADRIMKTDVKENEKDYEIDVDLPGFKKEDVKLQLKNGYLFIEASKGLDKDKKDDDGRYIRRERYSGSMSRSFYVGEDVTEKDVHAQFKDGILKLMVPKKEHKKVEQDQYIAIEG
ncbi:MAG: Hsp20/alpha crystallin family protein [Anaerostipes sp.]|nr:Hsp20/alpha crystallin family protein [Anaerostipes sp.]